MGRGRVERTQPLPFASDEPLEIGRDGGSSVTPEDQRTKFIGDVSWIDIGILEGAPTASTLADCPCTISVEEGTS